MLGAVAVGASNACVALILLRWGGYVPKPRTMRDDG
jgi:hypothetical protein